MQPIPDDRSAHPRRSCSPSYTNVQSIPDDRPTLSALLAVSLGANLFFRKMGINQKWGYTNNMQTEGKGSPFLSEEVTRYLRALRRQEVRDDGFVRQIHHPVTALEYCKFDTTMANYVAAKLDVLILECQAHVSSLG